MLGVRRESCVGSRSGTAIGLVDRAQLHVCTVLINTSKFSYFLSQLVSHLKVAHDIVSIQFYCLNVLIYVTTRVTNRLS
jgi:hypothetical protein